ncbi:MAG: hypothetical protein JXA97_03245 [Anaerolineales bacterium]|nr:hypothetical protein [Anaerolineales bacterium]
MNVGMLWLDSNTRLDVSTRVQSAAEYYRKKYGRNPTLCVIHPEMVDESTPKHVGAIEIRMNSCVLANHFWLGIEEESHKETAQVAA